ncbi:uncharacterized protein [Rutidosis leptorrhynchoides]
MQMDICSRIGYHGFCMDVTTLESSYELAGELSVDGLAYVASKFLNIKDDAECVSEKCVFQMKDERQEDHQSRINTSRTSFVGGKLKEKINDDSNVVTGEVLTIDDNNNDNISVVPYCSSTPSLPNPSKPVSAMKGSREKRGVIPPKQLTVKWAPDVYDPIPAPSLNMAFNKPRKHGSNKKYKSKQKTGSKSSRGSKGKDKKQVRKTAGFKLCEHKQEVIHVSKMQLSSIDFHLAVPELYCRSSFINRYGSSFNRSSVA